MNKLVQISWYEIPPANDEIQSCHLIRCSIAGKAFEEIIPLEPMAITSSISKTQHFRRATRAQVIEAITARLLLAATLNSPISARLT